MRVAIYTSPAHGHLVPALRVVDALSPSHEVHVRTLGSGIDAAHVAGASASPIARSIESIEMDDWRCRTPIGAIRRSVDVFGRRAPAEVDDVADLIRAERPDLLVVDGNCWGARAAAAASGLPWAAFQAFPIPLEAPGLPPFGPGLPIAAGLFGRLRDRLLTPILAGALERDALPRIDEVRRRVGLEPLDSLAAMWLEPPTTLIFTSREFEHPRAWPGTFHFVGPATRPAGVSPDWLAELQRPVLLATCSTEHQRDDRIIDAVIDAFGDTPTQTSEYDVVVTSGTHVVERRPAPNVRIEAFVPHGPLLERAAVVVCHGGMGITQAALAADVPVCVIPFGRDQPEVASRVARCGAGVKLSPRRLRPDTLRSAVAEARSRQPAAAEIGRSLRAVADPRRIVDALVPR